MVDQAKRKTLKTFVVSGSGVLASVYIPGVMAHSASAKQESTEASGLSIKHYKNFNGHTVLLKNATAQPATLKSIHPAVVSTPSGEVHLSKLLENGPQTVPANSTQAYSITNTGKVERYALWKHIATDRLAAAPASTHQSIKVTGLYDMMERAGSTRLHTAMVA